MPILTEHSTIEQLCNEIGLEIQSCAIFPDLGILKYQFENLLALKVYANLDGTFKYNVHRYDIFANPIHCSTNRHQTLTTIKNNIIPLKCHC